MNVRVNVGPKSQEAEASLLAQKFQENKSGGNGGNPGLKRQSLLGRAWKRGKLKKIKNVGNKFPKEKAKEYRKKAMEYGKKYGRKAMKYGKKYGPQAMEYIKKYGIKAFELIKDNKKELLKAGIKIAGTIAIAAATGGR